MKEKDKPAILYTNKKKYKTQSTNIKANKFIKQHMDWI